MSEDLNSSSSYIRSKSLSKLASRLKLRRGNSIEDATPEKFSNSIKEMKNYIVTDVGSYDHISREEGSKEVQKIDNINQAYYRFMFKKFTDTVNSFGENNILRNAFSPSGIEKPPCYIEEYNIHRDRMGEFSVVKYEIYRTYLIINGFNVFDPCIVDVSPHEHYIIPAKCVEPYQVIEKAETLAKERGDNIKKMYQINLTKNANAQRILAGKTPDIPQNKTTLSHASSSMITSRTSMSPTSYPSLENATIHNSSISRRDGWISNASNS
jgi:hypothetical protein